MGSASNESFEEFLNSLKQAGVAITNEAELRERLAEARAWRYAFTTLAAHGRAIGIRFEDQGAGSKPDVVHDTFARFHFSDKSEALFAASLKAEH